MIKIKENNSQLSLNNLCYCIGFFFIFLSIKILLCLKFYLGKKKL